jgi:hypothetical protein
MRTLRGQPRSRADLDQVGLSFLDSALDCLLGAKLMLAPDVRTWDAPTGTLGSALADDAEATRASTHLREIETRLRKLAPQLAGHFDEWRRELHDYESRLLAIGFAVGVEASRPQADDA